MESSTLTTNVAYVALGASATLGAGRAMGYLPGWYGPELPSWTFTNWNKEAQQLVDQLDADPSYVCTAKPTRSGRKVRISRYYSQTEKNMRGVVKYGSDCEGPPRCVHGGCTAATSNQIAIDFVSNLLSFPVAYSTSINVDYLVKIPLGSQLGFDCAVGEGTDFKHNKVVAKVRFFALKDGDQVFAEATVAFDNCQCVSHL